MAVAADDDARRRLDRAPARDDRSRPRVGPRRRIPDPTAEPSYLCAADRDGLLVSLIQTNFIAAGAGLHVPTTGASTCRTAGRRSGSTTRHPNGLGRAKLPMHTLIPALAFRDGRPWLVFGAMGGHTQAQTHLQLLDAHARRRRRPAGGDHRAALGGRSRDAGTCSVEDRVRRRASIDGLRARGHDVRRRPRVSTTAWATPTRSSASTRPATAAATDPRAEGAAAGRLALAYPGAVAGDTTRIWTIPNVISVVRLAVRARVPLAAVGPRTSRSRPRCCSRCSARPTGSTATSRVASTRAASSARSSTRPRIACCCVAAAVALLVEDLPIAVDIVDLDRA